MKTISTFLMLVALFCVSSCTKDTINADPGSWQLGSNTYKVAYAVKTQTSTGNTMFIFSDVVLNGSNTATANTLALTFKTAPTGSGSYQLVSSAGNLTAANQVQVSAGNQSNAYAYIGNTVNFEVTVTGGKVKITLPQISMLSASGGGNANLTASVQEQ